jgi:hypothetical protein
MSVQQSNLPIALLIRNRMQSLGITSGQLAARCGYVNIGKGLRRLDNLCKADWSGNEYLIQSLPHALEITPEELEASIAETQRSIEEAAEAAYRAAFVPHAIILTERKRPSSIMTAIWLGVTLRLPLDEQAGIVTFPAQAIKGIEQQLEKYNSRGEIPTLGKPTGFIVNYSPDKAVQFDLTGNPLSAFDRSHRSGEASLSISGRKLTSDELFHLLGR